MDHNRHYSDESEDRWQQPVDGNGLPVEKKVKILGGAIEVSPITATGVMALQGWVLPKVVRIIDKAVDRHSLFFDAVPDKYRETVRTGVKLALVNGTVFYNEAFGTLRHVKELHQDLNEINRTLEPLHQTSGLGGLSGLITTRSTGNEVVDQAIERAKNHFLNNMIGEGMKGLAQVPVLIAKKCDTLLEGHADAAARGIEGAQIKLEQARETHNFVVNVLPPVSGAIGQEFQSRFANRSMNVPGGGLAYDMIRHLSGQIDDNPGSDTVEKRSGGAILVREYVQEIFNRHQKNMGEPEVGKRFGKDLSEACDKIASAIIEGRMDAMALVNLIGERKIVAHGGKKITTGDKLDRLIDEQCRKFPAHANENHLDAASEDVFDPQEEKHLLSLLKERDKDSFIRLHSEEQMRRAGATRNELERASRRDGPQSDRETQALGKSVLSHDNAALEAAKHTVEEIQAAREVEEAGILDDPKPDHHALQPIRDFVANDRPLWEKIAKGTTSVAKLTHAHEMDLRAANDPGSRDLRDISYDGSQSQGRYLA